MPRVAAYAARTRQDGAPVSFIEIDRGEHTMLRRMPAFELLAARYTDAVLDPEHDVRCEQGYRSRLELLSLQARDVPADYRI